MSQVKIVVCRHPEKDGDAITPHGAEQAFAAGTALGKNFTFDCLLYSGANRTWQAALVMQAALGIKELVPQKREGFHFSKVFESLYVGTEGRNRFFAELATLNESSGGQATVADALVAPDGSLAEYANAGRIVMKRAIFELGTEMIGSSKSTALVLSHSPWGELACLHTGSTPFGLNEADAVIYTIRWDARYENEGSIIHSELIRAPIAGKGSYK